MTKTPTSRNEALYRRKLLSPVWIIPLVALIAVAILGIRSWHERGPAIAIRFEKVDGVEPQRTQIRHKGVVLGLVTSVVPADHFTHVQVNAEMNGMASDYLGEDAKFWVVHPRVSAGGITGLNTLISGAYIEMEPGHGGKTRHFEGLGEPLAIDASDKGTLYALEADKLPSIERGSPVYYRGLSVGEIANFALAPDGKKVTLSVFIHAPYDKLVHDGTRFWNISGVGLSLGAEGVKLSAASIQSILAGGVAFDVPADGSEGDIARPEQSFTLYNSAADANNSIYTHSITYHLVFRDQPTALAQSTTVALLGIPVGYVDSIKLHADAKTGHATTDVVIKIQPQKMGIGTPDGNGDAIEMQGRAAIRAMVGQGLRAQIATSNFLTEQKIVALTFIPDAPKRDVADTAEPELPTLPSNDLNQLIGDIDHLARAAGPQIGPLLQSLRATSDELDATLKDADSGDSSGNVSGLLHEMKEAARSVRALADYLDAHPESIIEGKEGDQP